jgi:enamine deaminase RidA (YjgF/YER057c/UK114 family)
MSGTPVNPSSLMAPKGYSNGMVHPPGRILFVAGQIGWDKEGTFASGLTAQFELALENAIAVVKEAGGGPEHIGRLTLYVVDKHDYLGRVKDIGAIYRRLMGKHYPAMALVQVAALLEDRALVEIEATAVL